MWRGWIQGLLRSLFGLLALGACAFYGYLYYQRMHNFLLSFVIFAFGPIILNTLFAWFCRNFLEGGRNAEGQFSGADRRDPLTVESHFLGALLNGIWGAFLVGVFVYLFLMIPVKVPIINEIQKEMKRSYSVGMMSDILGEKVFFLNEEYEPLDMKEDEGYLPQLKEIEEYEELMQDQQVRALFEDRETLEKIHNQDIMGLFSDERVQKIMTDPELIQKFLRLNQKMQEINNQISK